jgi:hypothetical protein
MLEAALAAIKESTANTLYYTLSTIAQTLSGAFALMAAFVVFKLQFTTARIADAARPVARAAGLVRLRREGKFQEVYDVSESAILAASGRKPYLATLRRELGRSLTRNRTLLRRFWFSTALTGVTLLYSVSLLSLTDSLVPSGCAGTVLAVAVALFTICIVSYALVLGAAVRDSTS